MLVGEGNHSLQGRYADEDHEGGDCGPQREVSKVLRVTHDWDDDGKPYKKTGRHAYFANWRRKLREGRFPLGQCDYCPATIYAPAVIEFTDHKPNRLLCRSCAEYIRRKAA